MPNRIITCPNKNCLHAPKGHTLNGLIQKGLARASPLFCTTALVCECPPLELHPHTDSGALPRKEIVTVYMIFFVFFFHTLSTFVSLHPVSFTHASDTDMQHRVSVGGLLRPLPSRAGFPGWPISLCLLTILKKQNTENNRANRNADLSWILIKLRKSSMIQKVLPRGRAIWPPSFAA